MRAAFVLALTCLTTLPALALAQATPRDVTTLTLDVIGPRTRAAVRAGLRAHESALDACRGEADALVRVAFSIAPDGSVLSPTSVEDPSLDREATECALGVLASLRFDRSATSVTSVAWTFRLAPVGARACFCFDWVHGPDHGHTCEPTRARCAAELRSTDRDATPCRETREPACEHDAWIGGQHVRADRSAH